MRMTTTSRPATSAAAIALVAALVVGCASEDGADPAGVSDTEAAPAERSETSSSSSPTSVVAQRQEPKVERITYPTPGPADSDQNWGDLYLPAGEHTEDSVPLVVLIHGGSWASQLGAESMDPYARDLVDRGMALYNIEYRRGGSGGGWPTTFRDVASALDHVVELSGQHPEFTIDDELVVGHSAGAQLAMWAGTRHALDEDEVGNNPKFRPTRVVSLAGPLDMTYAATHGDDRIVTVLGGTPEEIPARYTSVDPIQNIDPNIPVVAVHGTVDTMVSPENSERYIAAVKQQNGIGDLVLADGEDHVSLVSGDSAHYQQILDIIVNTSTTSVGELEQQHAG